MYPVTKVAKWPPDVSRHTSRSVHAAAYTSPTTHYSVDDYSNRLKILHAATSTTQVQNAVSRHVVLTQME